MRPVCPSCAWLSGRLSLESCLNRSTFFRPEILTVSKPVGSAGPLPAGLKDAYLSISKQYVQGFSNSFLVCLPSASPLPSPSSRSLSSVCVCFLLAALSCTLAPLFCVSLVDCTGLVFPRQSRRWLRWAGSRCGAEELLRVPPQVLLPSFACCCPCLCCWCPPSPPPLLLSPPPLVSSLLPCFVCVMYRVPACR